MLWHHGMNGLSTDYKCNSKSWLFSVKNTDLAKDSQPSKVEVRPVCFYSTVLIPSVQLVFCLLENSNLVVVVVWKIASSLQWGKWHKNRHINTQQTTFALHMCVLCFSVLAGWSSVTGSIWPSITSANMSMFSPQPAPRLVAFVLYFSSLHTNHIGYISHW